MTGDAAQWVAIGVSLILGIVSLGWQIFVWLRPAPRLVRVKLQFAYFRTAGGPNLNSSLYMNFWKSLRAMPANKKTFIVATVANAGSGTIKIVNCEIIVSGSDTSFSFPPAPPFDLPTQIDPGNSAHIPIPTSEFRRLLDDNSRDGELRFVGVLVRDAVGNKYEAKLSRSQRRELHELKAG